VETTDEWHSSGVRRAELFNIFVGDMESGIECSLSNFANDTKMTGVERREGIQRHLDRLET